MDRIKSGMLVRLRKIAVVILMVATVVGAGKTVSVSAKTTVKSEKQIALYAIDSANSKLKIPSKYQKTYQIKIPGNAKATYRVVEGESATVTKSGCIKPVKTIYYWNGNVGSTESTGAAGERKTVQYNYDDTTTIEATTAKAVYRYVVTIKDYAHEYADQVMDDYISKNMTASMSNMEKLEKIAQFPCQYDYSSSRSSVVGMIIDGGGDCWASTNAIIEMSQKLGFQARTRDGRGDPGAGSGHMNALVKVDGKLYIVEAGYDEPAPRYYKITEAKEYLYDIHADGKTITLSLYNGMDECVNVPASIDGYRVTEIGSGCYAGRSELRQVSIPKGIEKIGDGAFFHTSLQAVKIPSGVKEIGSDAFCALIDYHGAYGDYGMVKQLEVIELPKTVTKLGFNLSESTVLYEGTAAQWKKIKVTEDYQAPKKSNLFCNTTGIEASDTVVKLKVGQLKSVAIYSADPKLKISANRSGVVKTALKQTVAKDNFYRDGKQSPFVSAVKTLKIKPLKAGKTVLTVKNGSSSVKITVVATKA